MKETIAKIAIIGLGVIALAVILALVLSLPVMWLWNWLMPDLFGIGTITLWQAWGLLVLCGFLFRTSASSGK